MLNKIHAGHAGISACKERAKITVYWPSINYDIENLCKNYVMCLQNNAVRKEPLIASKVFSVPCQVIGMDIAFFRGVNHLVIIDNLSKWIEVFKLQSLTANAVIKPTNFAIFAFILLFFIYFCCSFCNFSCFPNFFSKVLVQTTLH
jgi:Integrase zinc binding domain